jgi:hypothetical protein
MMIPQDQTLFVTNIDGAPMGNCWQACIASLLDLPLNEVPHFCNDWPDNWYQKTRDFVIEKTGMDLGCFVPGFPHTELGQYVIGSGPSPRGDFLHSVILDGVTGELVHDPHFSREGIVGPLEDVIGLVSNETLL